MFFSFQQGGGRNRSFGIERNLKRERKIIADGERGQLRGSFHSLHYETAHYIPFLGSELLDQVSGFHLLACDFC